MNPRFKWLTGDVNYLEYGGKWISQKIVDESLEYYLVMSLDNLSDCIGDDAEYTYLMRLCVVSPSAVDKETRRRAFEGCGVEDDDNLTPEMLVEILHSYGAYSEEWSEMGNNYKLLRSECVAEAKDVIEKFIPKMNKPRNQFFALGWDFLAGDSYGMMSRMSKNHALRGEVMAKCGGDYKKGE